jgi:hypothetical protein
MLTAGGAEDIKVVREPLPPGSSVHEIGTLEWGTIRRHRSPIVSAGYTM